MTDDSLAHISKLVEQLRSKDYWLRFPDRQVVAASLEAAQARIIELTKKGNAVGLIPREALEAFEVMKQTMVEMQQTLARGIELQEQSLAKLIEIDANTEATSAE